MLPARRTTTATRQHLHKSMEPFPGLAHPSLDFPTQTTSGSRGSRRGKPLSDGWNDLVPSKLLAEPPGCGVTLSGGLRKEYFDSASECHRVTGFRKYTSLRLQGEYLPEIWEIRGYDAAPESQAQ